MRFMKLLSRLSRQLLPKHGLHRAHGAHVVFCIVPWAKTAFAHWFLGANSPHNLGEVECNAQGKQHLESYSAKAFERCECAQAPKPSAWGAQGRTLSTREVPGILATPCNARHVVAPGAAGRRAASTSRGYSGDTIWVPNARRQECVGLNSGRVLLVFLLDSDH